MLQITYLAEVCYHIFYGILNMAELVMRPSQTEYIAPSDCKICHDIWRHLTQSETGPEINLGTFENALSSDCPTHTPLVERFKDFYFECKSQAPFHTIKADDVGFRAGWSEGHSAMLTQSVSKLGLCWDLLLVNRETVPGHPGKGRILDPDWVDLDIVKKWKNECLSSHTKCENPMKIPRITPAWLIDVEENCVISGEGHNSFVALSYRWGNDAKFKADSNIMAKLQRPHALDDPEIAGLLPPIIHHAMYLASVIGERYMWADSLCIDHSDDAATGEQLNLMGGIYASAVVTIIAADGDSQYGLPGLKGVSGPRDLKQEVIPFGEETIIRRNTGIFSMGSGTPYYERGWTYQEYKMAQRRILFNTKEIHWECQCNVWHEELTFGTEVDKYIDPRLNDVLAGFPDLGSLAHIITNYNNRELTYDEDAQPGLSGLLSIVSRSFSGGFLYGLPEMMFDRALGWTPYWGHTELRRRKPSDPPIINRLPSSALPSWSWVGWQGLVNMGHGEAARINDRSPREEETFPITEWYTSNSPIGSSRRKIKSSWFENRDAFKSITEPLPPGWTAHESEVEDRIIPDGCSKRVFKHENLTYDNHEFWYYPFPVTDIQEFTPLFTPEQTPYLFCQTKRAHLWVYPTKPGRFPEEKQNIMDLRNEADENIGTLHLSNQEQRERFSNDTGTDESLDRKIELVAIYRSRLYSKTFDKEMQKYTSPHTVNETYKVLWIEYADKIAYRVASGNVDKAGWEALELEEVSLVLG